VADESRSGTEQCKPWSGVPLGMTPGDLQKNPEERVEERTKD